MTKLYKIIDGVLHYWEIWDSSMDALFKSIVHWGPVGDTGSFVEIIHKSSEALTAHSNEQVQAKRNEGYTEAEPHEMILQFQTGNDADYVKDLDFRNAMWEHLDEVLGWTGNGSISGGDIGSGACNLFFLAVDPAKAVQSIVADLASNQIEKRFLIALQTSGSDGDCHIQVLFPEGYDKPFRY